MLRSTDGAEPGGLAIAVADRFGGAVMSQSDGHFGRCAVAVPIAASRRDDIQWGKAALCVLLCVAVGAVAGLATTGGVREWYPTIAKPSWTPPNWLFGPVWTALYAAMGVSLYLIWRAGAAGRENRSGLALFAVQLVLNAAWSFLFFSVRAPGLALVEIVLLWLAIVATIVAAWPLSRLAATLLVPYLAWVSFALALNAAIWRLNS